MARESVWNKYGEKLFPRNWKLVQSEINITKGIIDRFWKDQEKFKVTTPMFNILSEEASQPQA